MPFSICRASAMLMHMFDFVVSKLLPPMLSMLSRRSPFLLVHPHYVRTFMLSPIQVNELSCRRTISGLRSWSTLSPNHPHFKHLQNAEVAVGKSNLIDICPRHWKFISPPFFRMITINLHRPASSSLRSAVPPHTDS